MPGVRMHFEFFGDTQIDRTLTAFVERGEDATPAFEAMRARFLDAERRQFDSQGHGSWPALSPRYGAWKATHFPGRPLLVRTGDLRRSLTEGPEVSVIQPRRAIFGSAVEYGVYHQQGTSRMPRRKVVDFSEAERRAWVKILERWLTEGRV